MSAPATEYDHSDQLCAQVAEAVARKTPLTISGGNTKQFLGRTPAADSDAVLLHTGGHRGVINYEPTELVITARAGTPLREIESLLHQHNQMLPFEPPSFGEEATLGGTIACNLSGPARPFHGAARDFVLGVRIINGKGEVAHFGGEVMKNVAGYDVSRLMAGAMGTLGVLLEISLKVLPRPETSCTLIKELAPAKAIQTMNRWAATPCPLSAACYDGDRIYLRLSGTAAGVRAARQKIGGDEMPRGDLFWEQIREQRHTLFSSRQPLWRISLAPATPPLEIPGKWLLDWGGAQRWLYSNMKASAIRSIVQAAGGHATLFRNLDACSEVFHPLPAAMMKLHKNLKQAFDPHGIFNPGRMYEEL